MKDGEKYPEVQEAVKGIFEYQSMQDKRFTEADRRVEQMHACEHDKFNRKYFKKVVSELRAL